MIKETKNQKLNKAKELQNDEFYTTLSDIEREIIWGDYWNELKGKKIWCNCDDEKWSKFYTFFSQQAPIRDLEVKYTGYQLIPDDLSGYTKKELDKPWTKKNEKGEIETYNYMYVDKDGYAKGDFRAEEQKELWEWADVIITNPPFSLFREFVGKIMEYNKKFLIVGAKTALTYKEITKLIIERKIWAGNNLINYFENGKKEKVSSPCCWYTNLKTPLITKELFLYKSYIKNKEDYKFGDNMDVLVVDKVKNIPYDYEGAMAVPISFMFKYNPEQFEIIADSTYYQHGWNKAFDLIVDGKRTFRKFIIKNKKVESSEEYE